MDTFADLIVVNVAVIFQDLLFVLSYSQTDFRELFLQPKFWPLHHGWIGVVKFWSEYGIPVFTAWKKITNWLQSLCLREANTDRRSARCSSLIATPTADLIAALFGRFSASCADSAADRRLCLRSRFFAGSLFYTKPYILLMIQGVIHKKYYPCQTKSDTGDLATLWLKAIELQITRNSLIPMRRKNKQPYLGELIY